MPWNTGHWDSMRDMEKRLEELKQKAEEDGIEVSDASVNALMSFMSALTPADGAGSNPTRLLRHQPEEPELDADEWRIPHD